MRLKIYQAGEPVLRQQAKPLSPEELSGPSVRQLIKLMRETMRDAPGVGLAAPQVGVSIQLLVIEDPPELIRTLPQNIAEERGRTSIPFHVIVNPVLSVDPAKAPATFFEACLSVSGYAALVPRARSVRVDCLNDKGEPQTIQASGWYARILQHEIDHLQGTLYVDRMHTRSLMTSDYYARNWSTRSIGEAELSLFGAKATSVFVSPRMEANADA